MKIITACESNIIEALFIIKSAYDEDNLFQNSWRPPMPDYNELKQEMEHNQLYLISEQMISIGTFSFTTKIPDSYNKINWVDKEGKTLFIKRIAIAPNWLNENIVRLLKEFLHNYAKENNYSSIKFYSLSTKENIQVFYKNLGFNLCEPLHPDELDSPLKYYETLSHNL
ncbi:MAG: hypothetical protein R6U04_13935 [Bacteroidales bacterium]